MRIEEFKAPSSIAKVIGGRSVPVHPNLLAILPFETGTFNML